MRTPTPLRATGIAVLLAGVAGLAQQPVPPSTSSSAVQATSPAAAPSSLATRPLIPVAASTLATSGTRYVGEPVSLTGAVDAIVGKQVFTVDQDATKSGGPSVLVLAPGLSADARTNRYVTVLGEVVTLTADVLAAQLKERAGDVPADVVTRFTGRPAVVAKTVLQEGTDLTRRLPPPLSPAEAAFAEVMKTIGPAFGELRKGLEAAPPTAARATTATLRKAFADTESFWKTRGMRDAVAWSADGRRELERLEKAAADARWNEAKTAAAALGKTCQACHGAHRERFDDGSYRIKVAAK